MLSNITFFKLTLYITVVIFTAQNTLESISEHQFSKIFWVACPQTTLDLCAYPIFNFCVCHCTHTNTNTNTHNTHIQPKQQGHVTLSTELQLTYCNNVTFPSSLNVCTHTHTHTHTRANTRTHSHTHTHTHTPTLMWPKRWHILTQSQIRWIKHSHILPLIASITKD